MKQSRQYVFTVDCCNSLLRPEEVVLDTVGQPSLATIWHQSNNLAGNILKRVKEVRSGGRRSRSCIHSGCDFCVFWLDVLQLIEMPSYFTWPKPFHLSPRTVDEKT